MDYLWLALSMVCLLAGLVGCFLPILPGPPLAYLGLLFLHLTTWVQFPVSKLIWGAVFSLAVVLLDQVIPMIGAKRFGGTKAGVWGCTIGMFVGLFMPPWGILLGPFFGAVLGEWFGKKPDHAWRAGFGAFLGFLCGTVIKGILCVVFLWWAFTELCR